MPGVQEEEWRKKSLSFPLFSGTIIARMLAEYPQAKERNLHVVMEHTEMSSNSNILLDS